MLEAAEPSVQWAAVRTWVEEMRVPPHQGVRPFLLTRPTCQKILSHNFFLCLRILILKFFVSLETDLPGVLMLLGLLTSNNSAIGSTTLDAALKIAKLSGKNDYYV